MIYKALVLAFIAMAAATTEKEYQSAFLQWSRTHSKSYSHDLFLSKYNTFKANHDFVAAHNARVAAGEKLHTVALNKFADLTAAEFAATYNGLKMKQAPVFSTTKVAVDATAPDSVDWRTKGAVTPVKNQQQCGSCWSFSTTGSTEGCHVISGGSLTSLSEQNLMDCSTAQRNQGCDGGLMTQAMQYITSNGGIDTEASYPYTAEDGTCSYNAANSGATLKTQVQVNSGDENDLQNKVALGPVSVAIDASHSSFQFYTSGIYTEPDCSSSQLDHGVLAAGYGSTAQGAYWLVKNSWGTDWGMNGYIQMSRNNNNMCGIATMATLPQGC